MSKHTPGPWRWEFSNSHKRLTLVGGDTRYDLTIMDFARWGMGGAVAVLRDPAEDGMNIMHRLCDRPDWIAPFPGRSHHADWCSDVVHPDMRLMAVAPELLEALEASPHGLHTLGDGKDCLCSQCNFVRMRNAAIAKAKGQS